MASIFNLKSSNSFLGISETGVVSLHSTSNTNTSSHLNLSSKTYNPDISLYELTSFDIFPYHPYSIFCVGYEEGRIFIYSIEKSKPIYSIQIPSMKKIKFLKWSRWRPTVLYILDTASTLYAYDFSLHKHSPVLEYKLTMENQENGNNFFLYVKNIKTIARNNDGDRTHIYLYKRQLRFGCNYN